MKYENNRVIDGDIGLESDQFDLSLTSSVKDFSNNYVNQVMTHINTVLQIRSSTPSDAKSNRISNESAKRITALYGNISDSESAGMSDFDEPEQKTNSLANFCGDAINIKVKNQLNNMNNIDAVIEERKTIIEIQDPEIRSMLNQMSHDTVKENITSTVSQSEEIQAKEYVNQVYQNSYGKMNPKSTQHDMPLHTEIPEEDEIEFIRVVTEESQRNSGNLHTLQYLDSLTIFGVFIYYR